MKMKTKKYQNQRLRLGRVCEAIVSQEVSRGI